MYIKDWFSNKSFSLFLTWPLHKLKFLRTTVDLPLLSPSIMLLVNLRLRGVHLDLTVPFSMVQQPPVGQSLIIEASRSHSDTPQSVRFLWTSDRLVPQTSTWKHTTLTRDRYLWRRRDLNPQFQQASGCRTSP
jgi:hypothetical protein